MGSDAPGHDRPDDAALAAIRSTVDRLRAAVEGVIVGKRAVIDRLLVAMLAEGHVLIEDVPGIGKTKLARALSRALGGTFQRIQFTPDLLPSDVSGSLVFDQRSAAFTFHPGPVFANVVLADEVNRTGPRTQAALLEAMEERQVTVERQTYPLPRPFLVVATQNPVELEGTFPLPEAQLDRFFLSTAVGYPAREDERDMLRRFRVGDPLAEVPAVTTPEELAAMIGTVRRVYVGAAVEDYVLDLVGRTRAHEEIELGASPRAALALVRAGQAAAAMAGRGFVIPDDVRALALPVLAHRIIPAARVELQGRSKEAILRDLIAQVPVPVEEGVEA
ncbi:MAG: MoxR family ATPase [Sphaerobacter sp.]|nr:MoxR family ATPase [Sphaerobacter sp.]